MRAVFSYLLILSAFCFSYRVAVASPENRCRVKHCLCKVRGDIGQNKLPLVKEFKNITTQNHNFSDLKNKCDSRKLTVFFEYDKAKLNKNDYKDITKYVHTNSFAGGFSLDGFASSDGSRAYNQRLSQSRVASVGKSINQVIRRPIRMNAQSFGERYSYRKDSAIDRKVTITPINDFVELLDLKKTNYYLIDQSGSMSKYWRKIQNYKFWSRSVIVYLSTVNYCENGSHLKEIGSFGGTHIWYSFWNLIPKMKPGSSITIVSDFQTPIKLDRKEWKRLKARLSAKNIKLSNVHFVQIKGAPVFYQITK